MPNRILREGILTSERIALLNWQEEVFYRRLMSVVDDFGRFHANPKLLRAACYPLLIDKVSDADIGKWLTNCVTAALVSVYPAPDGKRYLQLLDFRQQARAATSKFPQMDSVCAADATQTPSTSAADAHLGGDVFVVDQETIKLSLDSARQAEPHLALVAGKPRVPDCPHADILALWAEVLPAMPQHLPSRWKGTRADHLRARWRELAVEKGWTDAEQGLAYFRKFFGWIGKSKFLTGKVPPTPGRKQFALDLEWLVNPTNFSKVIEGKFHEESA